MQNDLAEGFAVHLRRWAEAAGEPVENLLVLAQAARLVSVANQDGHVCIDVETLADSFVPKRNCEEIAQCLRTSSMVAIADGSSLDLAPRPLVLDGEGRIYLHRYFDYERRLAASLMARVAAALPSADCSSPGAVTPATTAPVDWQTLAAALAWRRRLTVISGGPGTGKTTTVVTLLARLLAQDPHLRIALAAPTGKAAARMLEALRHSATRLSPELRTRLPQASYTLHRLLGVTADAGRFRHNADNPLPFDVVVVDEASMLDLALATRLIEAVPLTARLILLGDKDQLAAVEAGAVFAELSADPSLTPACIAALAQETATDPRAIQPPPPLQVTPLQDSVIWFCKSHRFPADSGIGRLAADINAGRGEAACTWMAAPAAIPDTTPTVRATVTWLTETADECPSSLPVAPLPVRVQEAIVSGFGAYLQALRMPDMDRMAIFRAFDQFRVLCAVRESPRGVVAINRLVDQYLRRKLGYGEGVTHDPWYPGRPVMVQRNDYALKVFNGEVGICLPDEQGKLMVYFPGQDGIDRGNTGTFRAVAPLRLPAHDSAYASTVHKSQGSEFATVLLLLPEQPSRVLSRELLYTGVTRATERVILAGSRSVFLAAVHNPTKRHSGLIARLREQASRLDAVDFGSK